MDDRKVRVRFAPSPTGFLHVGNARTALYNWLFARKRGGALVLRVEDTDAERSAPKFEKRLIEDLLWLGLDWDEGPDVGGPFGPYRQSARLEIHSRYARTLLASGKAYRCFCSPEALETERQEALAGGRTPVYSGRCRSLSVMEVQDRAAAGEPASVRLRTPREGELTVEDRVRGMVSFDLSLVGDPVLVRSSGRPAYNYAVVIDDHLMRISHVIRGEDHLANTVRQILTYKALGFPLPEFAHLAMVMGEDNTRLSKRHGATSVNQFARDGILPSALFNYLCLLGWAPPEGQEVLERDTLIRLFDLDKVSRSAAIFDYGKLHWLNRQHMRRLPTRAQAEHVLPFLQAAGLLPAKMTESHWDWLLQAVDRLGERADTWTDLAEGFTQLFAFSLENIGPQERAELRGDCGGRVIRAFAARLKQIPDLDFAAFVEMAKSIQAETGCRGRDLYHPLRLALTGRGSGLDLDNLIPLVESGARLDFPQPMKSCSARISEVLAYLDR